MKVLKNSFKAITLSFVFFFALTCFACQANILTTSYLLTAELPFFLSVDKNKHVDDAKNKAQVFLTDFEKQFNTKDNDSQISHLNSANANERIEIGYDFYTLFNSSNELNKQYPDFNPALFPIIKLWGLDNMDEVGKVLDKIPTDSEIDTLLPFCKMENFVVEHVDSKFYIYKTVDGAMLDFGAIAKGYATDVISDILSQNGVDNFLLNYAGNIEYKVSKKMYIPSIKVKNGVKNDLISISLKETNAAVITSGHYQRYFIYKDQIISHILDRNGRQGVKELSGVTIINENGALSDCLATVVSLMTKVQAIDFLNQKGLKYVVVDRNGEIVKNV